MKPEDSALTIFNNALELLDPAARAAYLKEACREDAALRQRVEKLLQAHDEAGGFFSQALNPTAPSRPGGTAPATVSLTMEKVGDLVGRYKLLEQIGEGGCGLVYMAEQQEPVRRRVALKVIKLGMDTKQVVARFEAERQALALMDHPNIARVLDAGATETGRPYFVMELVRGIKITDYCDRNKLDTEKRLDLFIQICQAIQHAHQKGIIHRDIKPSNILVTLHDGQPVPKVIDFGIAKATTDQRLTDKTLFTAFEQFLGTPAYMSPEQAEMSGLDVDTRSDIYSLGVLLYELLTGKTPFDAKELLSLGIDAMRRTIREQEPPRPSTKLHTLQGEELTTTTRNHGAELPRLIHQIRGDLDWIVMKCLEKDRARRYDTANGLAMDIGRHLRDEPVVARPPSKLYEFQKTVRRHKVGFAATAAIIIVLAVGVVVSTWQAARARRATGVAVVAQRRADESRNNEEKLRIRAEANEQRAETAAARSEQVAQFMKDMLKGVGPGVARGRDTKLLREILDQTVQRLNELKGQPTVEADLRNTLGLVYRDLGEYPAAAAMLRQALTLRKGMFGDESAEVAETLNELGRVLGEQKQYAEAEALLRISLAIRTKIFGPDSVPVVQSLNRLANSLRQLGRYEDSEATYRQVLTLRQQMLGIDALEVAESLSGLGIVLRSQDRRLDESEQVTREALAIRRKLLGEDHPSVAENLMNLGNTLRHLGRNADAEASYRDAIELRKRVLGAEHPEVAEALEMFAQLLASLHRFDEAESRFRQGLAIQQKAFGDGSLSVAMTTRDLAGVLSQQGKFAEAETLFRQAAALLRRFPDGATRDLATTLEYWGNALMSQKKPGAAETVYREALEVRRQSDGEAHPLVDRLRCSVAEALGAQGKLQEAEQSYREVFSNQPQPLRRLPQHLEAPLFYFANLLARNGKLPEAEATYRESIAQRRALHGNETAAAVNPLTELASMLMARGQLEEAEANAREALTLQRKSPENKAGSLATVLSLLAAILEREAKLDEAELLARENLSVRSGPGANRVSTWRARNQLVSVLLAAGKLSECETLLLSSYEEMKQLKIPSGDKSRFREKLQRLVQLYEATGQPDKAAEWKKRLNEFEKAAAKSADAPLRTTPSNNRNRSIRNRWCLGDE